MKRKIATLLAIAIVLLQLCACEPEVVKAPDILISVGEITEGMKVGDIPVYVTLDYQPVACETEWICYSEDGYRYLEADDSIPKGYEGRLDVYYYLPKGVEVTEDLPITVDAPGGVYDGTGDIGVDQEGCWIAWSHIQYAFAEPAEPETTATEPQAALKGVTITVGDCKPGTPVEEIPVSVKLDGVPAECRAQWVFFTETGYGYLEAKDVLPENYWGRLDVYYHLPLGIELTDDIAISVEVPGGTYEGTGEIGVDETGRVEVWSHIIYGTEPQYEQPVEETTEHSHDWVRKRESSKSATCEEDGWEHVECSVCGESYQTTLWAYGHNYSSSEIIEYSTCTQPGVRKVICERCGASYQETIEAHGHDYSDSETIEEPGCAQPGLCQIRCIYCGDSYQETIDAHGHDWSEYSYINNRVHQRTCSSCGAAEEASHTFADTSGLCTTCGEYIIN